MKTNKTLLFCILFGVLLALLAAVSLFVGKYPLTIQGLREGDELQWRVFLTLRLSRTIMGVVGGICLGVTGFVFQTVFRNALAAPDMLGVSSGASAGAAAGLLFLSGAAAVTLCAFMGALIAVFLALLLARLDASKRGSTLVLSGIAVNALSQTVLMCLKLVADPEKELASIEYWIMGSLSGIHFRAMPVNLVLIAVTLTALFLLYRQLILLSSEEGEARMLGVSVGKLRLVVLLLATLAVAATISLTGMISFSGLLAPHAARLLCKTTSRATMVLSGLAGGCILCAADILARSVSAVELPVSIFTSLLGAPLLLWLLFRNGESI